MARVIGRLIKYIASTPQVQPSASPVATKEEKTILGKNTNDAEEIIAKCKILFEIWLK